jgi:hypothetical protein
MPGESKIEMVEIENVYDNLTMPSGWDPAKWKPCYSVVIKGQELKAKITRTGDDKKIKTADLLASYLRSRKGQVATVVMERGVREGKTWAAIRDAIKDGKPVSMGVIVETKAVTTPPEVKKEEPKSTAAPVVPPVPPVQRINGAALGMLINNAVLLAMKTAGDCSDRSLIIKEGAFWFDFLSTVEATGKWGVAVDKQESQDDDIPF